MEDALSVWFVTVTDQCPL